MIHENALVHADYQGTTGLRVIKCRSGLEFINPGLLLVTPRQVWRGGISESRNPALQRLFALLRLGEREGSGGATMRRVWKEQHWRAPRIREDVEHGETHLELPTESLLPEMVVDVLVKRYGESFTGQDELGRIILVTAETEGAIDHSRVRELSDAHTHDITLKLRDLVRRGLLASSGKTRGTVYSPAVQKPAPLFIHSTSRSGDAMEEGSTHKPSNSTHKDANSTHKTTPSAQTGEKTVSQARGCVQDPVIARIYASDRAARDDVETAILHLCARDFVNLEQIAAQLNRSTRTIRDHYLRPLVGSGKLKLRFPNSPNHPAQAYRTSTAASQRENPKA